MKIGIISADTRISNETIIKIKEINEKYAKINNYQFIFENFNINDYHYEWEDLILNEFSKLTYYRFNLIEKYLNNFDYFVWIDSDACICNPNIKIEDLIDNEHDIFISQDGSLLSTTSWLVQGGFMIQKYLNENKLMYLQNPEEDLSKLKIFNEPIINKLRWFVTNPNALNCGFVIYKNSPIIHEFIKDIKKYYVIFEEVLRDQGGTAVLLRRPKYKNILKLLPLTTQGNPCWRLPDFTYNEDKNFICHFYGLDINENSPINFVKSIENNKWWLKFN